MQLCTLSTVRPTTRPSKGVFWLTGEVVRSKIQRKWAQRSPIVAIAGLRIPGRPRKDKVRIVVEVVGKIVIISVHDDAVVLLNDIDEGR